MSVTKRALFASGYFDDLVCKEERQGIMSHQIQRGMSGYQHIIKAYRELSNTDKNYIQRSKDETAVKIRGLLKQVKKHRHVEEYADELLPLLLQVKEIGEKGE